MRIIAGEFRGRPLLPPAGDDTRPITDRAKQSLFDILMPNIPDAVVFDVFAGTGSMGLECLSRGAKRAVFFEKDKSAVELLRKNIVTFKVADRSQVVASDLFKWFASPAVPGALKADLIFLDPPYRFLRDMPADLARLAIQLAERLSAGGIVVFRHDVADALELPPLRRFDLRAYGAMAIELLSVT
jgi:16S rRNA (guanine966-N2)-methyltransferase